MKVAASPLYINSLPLEGKVPRRGGYGTGGMKESEKMRFKQAIYGSSQATYQPHGADDLGKH